MRPIQGSAADLATLATLGSVLPAVERPFGLPCRRSSAALCELAGPSQIGLGDRSRFSVRVMTIARPPRQGNALRFRLALGLTARSQSASRGSRAAGGCIGSTRSACEPRWAKPGLGAKPGDISRAWSSSGGNSDESAPKLGPIRTAWFGLSEKLSHSGAERPRLVQTQCQCPGPGSGRLSLQFGHPLQVGPPESGPRGGPPSEI